MENARGTIENPWPFDYALPQNGEYIWRDKEHTELGQVTHMDGVIVVMPVEWEDA